MRFEPRWSGIASSMKVRLGVLGIFAAVVIGVAARRLLVER
jgi:hypothetical protein